MKPCKSKTPIDSVLVSPPQTLYFSLSFLARIQAHWIYTTKKSNISDNTKKVERKKEKKNLASADVVCYLGSSQLSGCHLYLRYSESGLPYIWQLNSASIMVGQLEDWYNGYDSSRTQEPANNAQVLWLVCSIGLLWW
jgi:hypothetical protein